MPITSLVAAQDRYEDRASPRTLKAASDAADNFEPVAAPSGAVVTADRPVRAAPRPRRGSAPR